jgi:hypothetical protein
MMSLEVETNMKAAFTIDWVYGYGRKVLELKPWHRRSKCAVGYILGMSNKDCGIILWLRGKMR